MRANCVNNLTNKSLRWLLYLRRFRRTRVEALCDTVNQYHPEPLSSRAFCIAAKLHALNRYYAPSCTGRVEWTPKSYMDYLKLCSGVTERGLDRKERIYVSFLMHKTQTCITSACTSIKAALLTWRVLITFLKRRSILL